jgi:hypothetical protein
MSFDRCTLRSRNFCRQKSRPRNWHWECLRILKAPVSERRPYPPISPKYRNPDLPSETWSGRSKQPRWLVAQLRSGRRSTTSGLQSWARSDMLSDIRKFVPRCKALQPPAFFAAISSGFKLLFGSEHHPSGGRRTTKAQRRRIGSSFQG